MPQGSSWRSNLIEVFSMSEFTSWVNKYLYKYIIPLIYFST